MGSTARRTAVLRPERLSGGFAGGMSEEQVLTDFPQLTRDDIRAWLAFGADRERRIASVPAI